MKRMTWLRGAFALTAMAVVSTAFAADHLDAPGVTADPSTDITDLYTWMDGSNVIFALDVNPLASATATFSTTAQYVIHTGSITKITDTPVPVNIICTFASNTKVSCWVGATEYVTGDPSATTGIMSADGMVKVFAGLRDDPFFFNHDGFVATVAAVEAAAPTLTFDAAHCPALSATTVTALDKTLSTNPNSTPPGGTAVDYFAGKNVLSIVLSINKSLLTAGGPVVSAWASTNKGP